MDSSIKRFLATTILCVTLSVVSFAQEYEYVSIVQFKSSLHISGTNLTFEATKIKTAHHFDYQELFKKAAEFEAEGWEIQNQQIDASAYPSMTLWMRRKL